MPLYEYKCAHCGKRFEALQKFSDAPLTVHAECGSGPVERLISPPAFNFKGSGWYVTDYAKGNGAKPDTSSSSSGDGKSESKSSESKSESKADSSSNSSPAPAASTSSGSSDKSDK